MLSEQDFPELMKKVFASNCEADTVFSALLPTLCEMLKCDRCFLYLRDPHTHLGKTPDSWLRN